MKKKTYMTLAWLLLSAQLITCKSMPVVGNGAEQLPTSVLTRTSGETHDVRRSIKGVVAEVESGQDAVLQRHIAAMSALGGPALIADNRVELLIDGPQAYAAMFSAMERAHNNINLEVYILQDDEVGNKLVDTLLRKRKQSVQVNLIYDSLGSVSTDSQLFKTLQDAGVRVLEFNPVNPAQGKTLDLNNRDHRKILIVDGQVGFTGGINISNVYSRGSAQGKSRAHTSDDALRKSGWRDTQIEISGPAVQELQKIFFDTWNAQYRDSAGAQEKAIDASGADHSALRYFPKPRPTGDEVVQVIASSPDDNNNIIYSEILMAIKQAKYSVQFTMAYFSPDEQTIQTLSEAAKRGVEVTLVLPGFSDSWLIFEAGRAHYAELLKSGVKIYERHDALLHAKTVVIDGVWSTVGSSNMDMRSFLHNSEVNVVVLGSDFGREMEAMFARDVEKGTLVTPQNWSQRPLTQRLGQWFANIWSYWL